MFERFTDRARRAIVLAQEQARQLGHNYIGTEHLLLGLIEEGEGIGARALSELGISLNATRAEIERIIGSSAKITIAQGDVPFTPRAKHVLELSLRESLQLGHNYIGTEHVLLGLLREGNGVAAQALQRLGASLDVARAKVVALLAAYTASSTAAPPAGLRVHRYSPGLLAALTAAEARAGTEAVVGTHHVLAVFTEWTDLAASGVLAAGGFDRGRLDTAIDDWDVADTRDETEDQWGIRVTDVSTDDDTVIVQFHDPQLRVRIREALQAGADDEVKAALGRALRQLHKRLPDPPPDEQEPDTQDS